MANEQNTVELILLSKLDDASLHDAMAKLRETVEKEEGNLVNLKSTYEKLGNKRSSEGARLRKAIKDQEEVVAKAKGQKDAYYKEYKSREVERRKRGMAQAQAEDAKAKDRFKTEKQAKGDKTYTNETARMNAQAKMINAETLSKAGEQREALARAKEEAKLKAIEAQKLASIELANAREQAKTKGKLDSERLKEEARQTRRQNDLEAKKAYADYSAQLKVATHDAIVAKNEEVRAQHKAEREKEAQAKAEEKAKQEEEKKRLKEQEALRKAQEKKIAKFRDVLLGKNLGLVGKFAKRLESVTLSRIARSLINTVIRSVRTGVQDLYKWSQNHNGPFAKASDQILQDFRYMADIIGSIVGPFIEALAPKIREVADAFAEASERANQFFATLLGRNGYYRAIRVARQYAGIQNQLLGFDELNVLKGDNGSGGGNFEDVSWNPAEKLSALGKLMTTAGLVQMGIGAILLFSGHPLLGASLIASGISTALQARNGEDPTNKLNKVLKTITTIVSGFSLALGGVLLAVGGPANLPIAIALLVAGASGLVSQVAINWDSILEAVRGPIGALTAFFSSAFLVLGFMALFTPGARGLGVALIIAGATGLVASVSANWDSLINWFKQGFKLMKDVAIAFLTNIVAQFLLKIETIKSYASALWEALKKGASVVWEALKDGARLMFEFVIGKIATLVEKFKNIVSWITEIFGKKYTLDVELDSTVSGAVSGAVAGAIAGGVPTRAGGGEVKTGTLFWAGEAGPELVTSLNHQTTVYNESQLAGSLASANAGVIEAVYAMAGAVVTAIDRKDTSINVNDMRGALNTQSLRYGL